MRMRATAARRWTRGAVGVLAAMALWELAGRSAIVDPALLPLASDAIVRAGELLTDEDFLADVGSTLLAATTGLLLATALAVPLGAILGFAPRFEEAARPVIEFLRPIPSVALIPLVLILLPSTFGAEVVVIVYASSWPILINTMYGLRQVDPVPKETLQSFGFGPRSVLLRVSLPSAAPFISTGVRLSAAIALILAISIEFIAGGVPGIGQFLIQASSSPDGMLEVIAAVLWAGAIGITANALLAWAERRLFHWRSQS